MGTALYGGLLWNSLTLLRKPQESLLTPALFKGNAKMRLFSLLLLHFLAFNFITGACVAGISSGKVFNDWPFYNGEIVPQ